MPSYLEELCQSNRVGRNQKDTGEPLAIGSVQKRCRDARRLQAHWEVGNTGELNFLQVLSGGATHCGGLRYQYIK